MSTLFGNKICSFYIISKQYFEKEIYIITAIYGKFHYETQTQQTELGKVQASQKNFKENIFHHVMQVDAYTLKKAIQKIQFKRIFVSKNLRSTIRF